MPKMKTHSGTKKRFKISGSGKVIHERTNMQHLFEGKSSRRTRRLSVDAVAAPPDAKKIKKLLGR